MWFIIIFVVVNLYYRVNASMLVSHMGSLRYKVTNMSKNKGLYSSFSLNLVYTLYFLRKRGVT